MFDLLELICFLDFYFHLIKKVVFCLRHKLDISEMHRDILKVILEEA